MPTLQEIQAAMGNLGVQIPTTPNINPSTMASVYGDVAQAQNAFSVLGQRTPTLQDWINMQAGITVNDLQGNYQLRNDYLGGVYANTASQLAGQRDFDLDRYGAYYDYNAGRTNAEADFTVGALGRNWGDLQNALSRNWGDTQYALGRNRDVTLSGEAGQLSAANQSAAAREAAARRDYANHTAMLQLARQREAETLYASAIARGFENSGVNTVTRDRFRQDYTNQGTELSNIQQAVMEAAAAARAGAQASHDYAVARANAGYDIGMRSGLSDYELGMRAGLTDYELGVGRTNLGRDWDLNRYQLDRDFGVRAANNAYDWGTAELNTTNTYQTGLNNQNYITGMANTGLNQLQGMTQLGWNLADAGTQAQMAATIGYLRMLASAGR